MTLDLFNYSLVPYFKNPPVSKGKGWLDKHLINALYSQTGGAICPL